VRSRLRVEQVAWFMSMGVHVRSWWRLVVHCLDVELALLVRMGTASTCGTCAGGSGRAEHAAWKRGGCARNVAQDAEDVEDVEDRCGVDLVEIAMEQKNCCAGGNVECRKKTSPYMDMHGVQRRSTRHHGTWHCLQRMCSHHRDANARVMGLMAANARVMAMAQRDANARVMGLMAANARVMAMAQRTERNANA
jgi:hypothetical protein